MVSNLLPIFTVIGAFAEHALIGDHADSKIINSDTVILTAHYFWRHVAGRA